MMPLFRDDHFTFRFADDRIILRFHLAGVTAGVRVAVFQMNAASGERLGQLATAIVGDAGWVDLPSPLVMRAGEGFLVVPCSDPIIRSEAAPQ